MSWMKYSCGCKTTQYQLTFMNMLPTEISVFFPPPSKKKFSPGNFHPVGIPPFPGRSPPIFLLNNSKCLLEGKLKTIYPCKSKFTNACKLVVSFPLFVV